MLRFSPSRRVAKELMQWTPVSSKQRNRRVLSVSDKFLEPNGLALSPSDPHCLYVADRQAKAIVCVDLLHDEVVRAIECPDRPVCIQTAADGKSALVTMERSVVRMDLATGEALVHYECGPSIDADGNRTRRPVFGYDDLPEADRRAWKLAEGATFVKRPDGTEEVAIIESHANRVVICNANTGRPKRYLVNTQLHVDYNSTFYKPTRIICHPQREEECLVTNIDADNLCIVTTSPTIGHSEKKRWGAFGPHFNPYALLFKQPSGLAHVPHTGNVLVSDANRLLEVDLKAGGKPVDELMESRVGDVIVDEIGRVICVKPSCRQLVVFE